MFEVRSPLFPDSFLSALFSHPSPGPFRDNSRLARLAFDPAGIGAVRTDVLTPSASHFHSHNAPIFHPPGARSPRFAFHVIDVSSSSRAGRPTRFFVFEPHSFWPVCGHCFFHPVRLDGNPRPTGHATLMAIHGLQRSFRLLRGPSTKDLFEVHRVRSAMALPCYS